MRKVEKEMLKKIKKGKRLPPFIFLILVCWHHFPYRSKLLFTYDLARSEPTFVLFSIKNIHHLFVCGSEKTKIFLCFSPSLTFG